LGENTLTHFIHENLFVFDMLPVAQTRPGVVGSKVTPSATALTLALTPIVLLRPHRRRHGRGPRGRLLTEFQRQTTQYREGVYRLTGWKVHRTQDEGLYRLPGAAPSETPAPRMGIRCGRVLLRPDLLFIRPPGGVNSHDKVVSPLALAEPASSKVACLFVLAELA